MEGGGGGGDETEITVMFSRFVYTCTHTRARVYMQAYACTGTVEREENGESHLLRFMHDSAAVSHFICCLLSAKLYLLMVMPFRGTYLFILRGLLG